MAQHKWHKEIKAWADGIEVQWKAYATEFEWIDVGDGRPMWHRDDVEFRIKQQSKEPQYLYVYKMMTNHGLEIQFWDSKTYTDERYLGRTKLEIE